MRLLSVFKGNSAQQIQAHYMKSVIGAGLRPQFTVRITPPGTHTIHLAALRHFVSHAEQH